MGAAESINSWEAECLGQLEQFEKSVLLNSADVERALQSLCSLFEEVREGAGRSCHSWLEKLMSQCGDGLQTLRGLLVGGASFTETESSGFTTAALASLGALKSYLTKLEAQGDDSESLYIEYSVPVLTLCRWHRDGGEGWGMVTEEKAASPFGDSSLEEFADGIYFVSELPTSPHVAPVKNEVEVVRSESKPSTQEPAQSHQATPQEPVVQQPVQKSSAPEPKAAQNLSYLMFRASGKSFALSMPQVIEILECRKWCPLPVRRENILGVLNLRGQIVPIMDLPLILQLKTGNAEQTLSSSIIIASSAGKKFGFSVDEVLQVADLGAETIQRIEDTELRLKGPCIRHVSQIEGQTVFFIDLSRIFL